MVFHQSWREHDFTKRFSTNWWFQKKWCSLRAEAIHMLISQMFMVHFPFAEAGLQWVHPMALHWFEPTTERSCVSKSGGHGNRPIASVHEQLRMFGGRLLCCWTTPNMGHVFSQWWSDEAVHKQLCCQDLLPTPTIRFLWSWKDFQWPQAIWKCQSSPGPVYNPRW